MGAVCTLQEQTALEYKYISYKYNNFFKICTMEKLEKTWKRKWQFLCLVKND